MNFCKKCTSLIFFKYNYDSMNVGKVTNLESMASVHCTTLLGHVTIMKSSCFDTDFVSQMKLTTLPLIHCFKSTDWIRPVNQVLCFRCSRGSRYLSSWLTHELELWLKKFWQLSERLLLLVVKKRNAQGMFHWFTLFRLMERFPQCQAKQI